MTRGRNLSGASTIVAIATPPGTGGIGVIRLSGPDARIIGERLSGIRLQKPRFAYYGRLKHPETQAALDDGLILYFPGPHSYTGEDVVECHLHGNPMILSSVLSACLFLGATLAGPGEFTARAFLNGKLDLTQAEAVADLIHANSEQGARVALGHLKGRLFQHLHHHRQQLMRLLEHLEGSLDFPDEIPAPPRLDVQHTLQALQATLQTLIQTADYGKIIRDGVRCVIVGRPNAGKSSLLNRLLGENRAIVSPIPGTTRDFIEAHIQLGGLAFHLIDTAGVRDKSIDPIELMGIRKVRQMMRQADALLWVVDGSLSLQPEDMALLASLPKKIPLYLVLNKTDKTRRFTLKTERRIQAQLPVSAKSGSGIAALQETLIQDFIHRFSHSQVALLCNARQRACLQKSKVALDSVVGTLNAGFEWDAITYDLKAAIMHLGEATGDAVTEEVLDGIFSRFCVGK